MNFEFMQKVRFSHLGALDKWILSTVESKEDIKLVYFALIHAINSGLFTNGEKEIIERIIDRYNIED